MGFLDLGAHLGAELLGRQNVALLIERGTLQHNQTQPSAEGQSSPHMPHTTREQEREMSSGLETTQYKEMHWNNL